MRHGWAFLIVVKSAVIGKGNTMAEEVRAPLVEPGAKVEEDDELVVVEALKMENPVCSPRAGTVKEILVKKGDKVEEDAVLVVID
jgi:acetyl-CoA carboxylase biotin carboxyl carrier protein